MGAFVSGLKAALVGDAQARFVFAANMEVERQWALGEVGLPRLSSGMAVVNRMDELALLLAGPDDVVLLKEPPDEEYLAYLTDLGLQLPQVVAGANRDPERTVTQEALDTPDVLDALAKLAGQGHAYLLPHGVSTVEEELAERTGLPLATSDASVAKAVNSKVYSRRLARRLGLRQPPGAECATLAELAEVMTVARRLVAGGCQVVVKDAYGVSGKGIVVVSEARRLDTIERLARSQAARAGHDRVSLVVEEWVAKRADLNYQLTVARDGSVHFDFVKDALTDHGVHKGHRVPARLDRHQLAEIRDAAGGLGGCLAADGYYGVVGVDAMLDPAGGVYPVTEINARHNMSTYQAALGERFVDEGCVALARHYALDMQAPLGFGQLRQALDGLLCRRPGEPGLVVNAFATVNAAAPRAAAPGDPPFAGRLYGIVVAASDAEVDTVDAQVVEALGALTEGTSRGSRL